MLSAAEIASMQATLTASLPDTATLRRPTPAADGQGGQATTPATIGTVACRRSPLGDSPQERAIASKLQGVTPYLVTVPAGTDVRLGDTLVLTTTTLNVVGIITRSWELGRRVVCVELK